MIAARIAAVLIWLIAAGFGIPALPVARYRLAHGELPLLVGFRAYGGGFLERASPAAFALLLGTFVLVSIGQSYAAWLLWNGARAGGLVSLALLPIEILFWIGFALPIPVVFGLARLVCLALAWKALT